MKITSLKELQAIPPMWRVLDSTYTDKEEAKKMIGGDFLEAHSSRLLNFGEVVGLYNTDKSDYYNFNRSDLQPLTPVQYKGRYVGEGDKILHDGHWREVFGSYFRDGKFYLNTAKNNDYSSTWPVSEDYIEDIRPLYPQKDTEVEKAIQLLKDKGLLVDGKVLK